MNGKWLGTDGKNDYKVYFVDDSKSQKQLKQDARAHRYTSSSIKSEISTTAFVLQEVVDVYDRTAGEGNNGQYEEASAVWSVIPMRLVKGHLFMSKSA